MAPGRIPGTFGVASPLAGLPLDAAPSILPKAGQQNPRPLQSSPPPAPATIELTVLGDYPNPFSSNPALEAKLSKQTDDTKPHWSPGSDTFEAVARAETGGFGKIETCDSLDALLTTIIAAAGSVSRLNIISHGDSGRIGLKGEIKAAAGKDPNDPSLTFVTGDVFFARSGLINSQALGNPAIIPKRDQARAKFAAGGHVFIYSCHSGSDKTTVKQLATFFNVPVTAIENPVGYFPVLDAQTTQIINRKKTGVLGIDGKPDPLFTIIKEGFKHIDNDPSSFTQTP